MACVGLGREERRALAVGRDLVDHALVAGAGEHVAFGIDGERPDVFVVGIEERRRLALRVDAIDAAVWRRADVQAAVRRRRERVHLHLVAVEEDRAVCRCDRRASPCRRCRCRETQRRPAPGTIVQTKGAPASCTRAQFGAERQAGRARRSTADRRRRAGNQLAWRLARIQAPREHARCEAARGRAG